MIPWFKPRYWGNEKRYVMDALDSSWISGGEYIRKFESAFSIIHEKQGAVTVSNGTTALLLALLTLKIGPGDEVIIPGYTFAAPANMVIAIGAKPVFIDVDSENWLLDPDLLEEKITHRTKAIIPVHIYGNVCYMKRICEIAAKYNLHVIEDVAEAAFSKHFNQYAGTFGSAGCFSFQATKTLTMGEGGAVLFSDPDDDQTARVIRSHGMTADKPYWHIEVGHNFRLTNMQAAFGFAQLEKLDDIIQQKQRVYSRYIKNLTQVDGIKIQSITENTDPVMWAVCLRIDPEKFRISRDAMRKQLAHHGIETRAGFYVFNEMPLYSSTDLLPISTEISRSVISLPSFPGLLDNEIDEICETFTKIGMDSYV
ncbi:cell wall biosynthesis regulatory pyridoxal phosphate-dependent protein [Legionella moravica]|uniref:Cell wall biosynthesis regulatory pyridoxal phosphate-dependent protein n=1 Tax=Legionella moravica TaxID=39962 RepID=A0A378K2F7_9GAMM|nr:DegT/DnrJ/EryC1/StrS family aminotransferase [Legionella moravica]KTD30737.1 cell wall biosynthesis regulatory pyridoxal phosphate-dependent protein [Legionella moravica]STX63439.1 pyridoxal phosphate-dependent enzyme [Legionella moravica]